LKPFIFDHPAVLAGGFDDVAATWRRGPHVSPIFLLSLLSSLLRQPAAIPCLACTSRRRRSTSSPGRLHWPPVELQLAIGRHSSSPPCPPSRSSPARYGGTERHDGGTRHGAARSDATEAHGTARHGATRRRCTTRCGTTLPPHRITPPTYGATRGAPSSCPPLFLFLCAGRPAARGPLRVVQPLPLRDIHRGDGRQWGGDGRAG
jgi:hypothetical protein